jgi:phosphoglucosamine mutase
VIVDCANGAAFSIARRVLGELGADVTLIHADPDGSNINAGCGSTYPEDLQAAVRAQGADVGLALDGDADRVLTVDASGALIDGDHLIAMCAIDLHERGELRDDTVVVTVMTNLGFRIGMEAHGIRVVETAVGDRAVFAAMEAGGYNLGGEQSGHVIFRDVATTGDGVLTGLWILDLVRRSGRPLAELALESMSRLPQVLVNVAVARPHPDVAELIATDIAGAAAELGDHGRVLVRPSGTEPLVRVMVEAPTQAGAEEVAGRLASAVKSACSA